MPFLPCLSSESRQYIGGGKVPNIMLGRLRQWWYSRKAIKNSKIQIFVSRKTTLPLEKCTVENLRTGARYDIRKASMYEKHKGLWKDNHKASAQWYRMAARALEGLASKLEHSKYETVGEMPYKKRKQEMETLLRLSSGKAYK